MTDFTRSDRVAVQLRKEIAVLVHKAVRDHALPSASVSDVEVTRDMAHAKIFFSLLSGDVAECELALNEAAGFLRNSLFKKLQIHTVPTLHFHFDRTTERAADLSALIAKANATRAKDDE